VFVIIGHGISFRIAELEKKLNELAQLGDDNQKHPWGPDHIEGRLRESYATRVEILADAGFAGSAENVLRTEALWRGTGAVLASLTCFERTCAFLHLTNSAISASSTYGKRKFAFLWLNKLDSTRVTLIAGPQRLLAGAALGACARLNQRVLEVIYTGLRQDTS